MAKAVVFENFEGGWSTDLKVGIKNSQAYTQALDFRKSPSKLTVLPGPTREDAGVCKDLIVNEVMSNSGAIYAFGNAGYFYKRSTAGVWSAIGDTGTGYFGMDYRQDSDSIYLCGAKSVSLYNPVSSNSAMLVNKYGSSLSFFNNSAQVGFNVSANQESGQLTTALVTSITEDITTLRYFQSDIEPLVKISVYVVDRGTGDWTLTLHDGLQNVIGTATVAHANLVNNTWNDFTFTAATNGQVRIYIAPNARTYHLHLTSTVADGTIASSSTNNLSTANLRIYADRLIQTNNGLHPMTRFLQYEAIGNSNYLSIWEPLSDPPTNDEWRRHRLVFPQEYEVCGLAKQNEFLVIAAEQTATASTSIPQAGVLFFWDGVSDTYNYFVEIPEGSPHGLHSYKNIAYYYAGGAWWAITSAQSQPVKLRTMPGSDTEFSGATAPITVYPYAATVRRGIHLMGYPSVTTNTGVNFGVYSWGSVDKNYPESFGYSYLVSTGSQNYSASNNLQIGMVKSFGDLLHISWRDSVNGGYGLDVVSNSSIPAAYSKWQGMIFDNGYAGKEKTGLYMEVYYSLPAGATVTMGYSIDRGAFVTDTNAYSASNLWQGKLGYARFGITTSNGGRFYEIQPQIEITSSGSTTPAVYMVSLIFDDNSAEALN